MMAAATMAVVMMAMVTPTAAVVAMVTAMAAMATAMVARLHIPVFRNLFFGPKIPFLPGFLRISFFLCFPEEFFTGTWFWRWPQEFLFFAAVTGFFCRNSCGTGIPVFTLDCSGFLQILLDSCSRQTLSGSGQRLK